MLKFLTSISFLYAFSILLLFAYGWIYYRNFRKNGYQRRIFPWVFLLIAAACFSFLYSNIHAPLSLKTFSNLDHHFIRHDGFRVASRIELGRMDTANYKNNPYNSFALQKANGQIAVHSSYSEEPFYISAGNVYKLGSVNYPATGHALSLQVDTANVQLQTLSDTSFALFINGQKITSTSKQIKKGLQAWGLFKDDLSFINTNWYTQDRLVQVLKGIYLLRDNVSKEKAGELKYFISGKTFRDIVSIQYDATSLSLNNLVFSTPVADKSILAWGVGFLDNNRNQFRVNYLGADSFLLANRYPVSYPLTAEERGNWKPHTVNKFLVSDGRDMQAMPDVFSEGFLFAPFDGDNTVDFAPVLLSYREASANEPLALQVRSLDGKNQSIVAGNELLLPARSSNFAWAFSIQNSFNWRLGSKTLPASTWQLYLFGSLFIFFALVFACSWIKPAHKLSWIWQLLTCVTLVLLTTRFFLYWRYKSFPPYEGMDLPSVQQLNSFWNFGIIIVTSIVLGIVFGYSLLAAIYTASRKRVASLLGKPYYTKISRNTLQEEKISAFILKRPIGRRLGLRLVFFISWVVVLIAGGAFAAMSGFDPTVCRHLAIGLVLFYFLFLYISYRYSPLVTSVEKSWWSVSTGRSFDIIINNPVKVLLSISLLGLFSFVDIGFAIVFLNFLLFNEAFLCINYAVAGLSAGSKRNASLFGVVGILYLFFFAANLVYGPYLFKTLLNLPQSLYAIAYAVFAILLAYITIRLIPQATGKKKALAGLATAGFLFAGAFLFFPKDKILDKAGITKYRIDVMTMPAGEAIETAYQDGKTYEPVIRAAQNQWFINTFIYEKNNPAVSSAGFHLLPHAPQNKGAKYNAQATDLVASRFFIAEHGKWSVLLYMLLLLVPISLLASFYKLYPDFTNRINNNYPVITTGFSLLNYFVITALLVILAATGRYIFFGQDMPFGSILSKQSILFPSIVIVCVVMLFRKIPLEHYPNRKKLMPGAILFTGLGLLLFLVKPAFNKDREFGVAGLAKNMDAFIELRLQPVFDYFDTARNSRRLSISKKDQLFTDSVRKLFAEGYMADAGRFLSKELEGYIRGGFSRHLDQNRLLYLDLNTGHPQLAVNDNYFHIEAPPHLQQAWRGSVYGDTANYNVTCWNAGDGSMLYKRVLNYAGAQKEILPNGFELVTTDNGIVNLVNKSGTSVSLVNDAGERQFANSDTIRLRNPERIVINTSKGDQVITVKPDAFMKNYYVNGSRYYVYPMGSEFIWARNFAESISAEYNAVVEPKKNAFVSLDAMMMDSLTAKIKTMMTDTAYKKGAEYGIAVADGNGRLLVMSDFIKDLNRPDPNDKAGFNKVIRGDNGFLSQSLLRKQVGNINLLRMNPGPGSTLKPIVFSSIASQLNLDWDAFAAEGFSQKQQYFGGEKVAPYDFEKNNGTIRSVADYLRYSDNYYHSNLLLLGSYSRQGLQELLMKHFATQNPEANFHWPYFNYKGKQYWLNGFANWPGYENGKANFGSDSSFVSIGLMSNYGIYTYRNAVAADRFTSSYDSLLFRDAYRKSAFILPEYALFDQKGTGMDNRKPNEVFMSSFRGHVKGSSQVMVPPVKMVDAFGKMISQNRNYGLTLNPYATEPAFNAFAVDNTVSYNNYLSIIREKLFEGLSQVLFKGGTGAALGNLLKNGSPYYYYAKTGTTGDDESKAKSKLFAIIISQKDVTAANFNFRNNKFYTIYFTSQNGPAKQNEQFQAAVIKYIENTDAFKRYMGM